MITGVKYLRYAVTRGTDGELVAAFMNVGDARHFAKEFSGLNKRTYIDVVDVNSRSKGLFYEGKEYFVKGF